MVVCAKCGQENEDWNENCIKCRHRLKPIILPKSAVIFLCIAMVLEFACAILELSAVVRNYQDLSVGVIIYGVIFSIMLIASLIGLFVLVNQKLKRGLVIYLLLTCIAFIYSIVINDSPLMVILVFIPVFFGILMIRDEIRDMPM